MTPVFSSAESRAAAAEPRRAAWGPAFVPPCRCGGRCRCGGLVPVLLLESLERECEFYRHEL